VGGKQVFFALAALGPITQPFFLHPIHGTAFGANDFHSLLHFTPPFSQKLTREQKAGRFSNEKTFPISIY
jgi:hypothetical protein